MIFEKSSVEKEQKMLHWLTSLGRTGFCHELAIKPNFKVSALLLLFEQEYMFTNVFRTMIHETVLQKCDLGG